jgi:electron transfer flavoprotein alpha subunit
VLKSPETPGGAGDRRGAVRHLAAIPPDARSMDLVHAKRIVAAGMGTADEKLLAAVHELADLLEGSVGATRPMVDDGRLSKERLIGQTGRTVSPELYVALGLSGSPHHVAGVRKADRVLSVNRDARAPIFQFSDVGYVADLEAVLPALIEKIKDWRDSPSASVPVGGDLGSAARTLDGAAIDREAGRSAPGADARFQGDADGR